MEHDPRLDPLNPETSDFTSGLAGVPRPARGPRLTWEPRPAAAREPDFTTGLAGVPRPARRLRPTGVPRPAAAAAASASASAREPDLTAWAYNPLEPAPLEERRYDPEDALFSRSAAHYYEPTMPDYGDDAVLPPSAVPLSKKLRDLLARTGDTLTKTTGPSALTSELKDTTPVVDWGEKSRTTGPSLTFQLPEEAEDEFLRTMTPLEWEWLNWARKHNETNQYPVPPLKSPATYRAVRQWRIQYQHMKDRNGVPHSSVIPPASKDFASWPVKYADGITRDDVMALKTIGRQLRNKSAHPFNLGGEGGPFLDDGRFVNVPELFRMVKNIDDDGRDGTNTVLRRNEKTTQDFANTTMVGHDDSNLFRNERLGASDFPRTNSYLNPPALGWGIKKQKKKPKQSAKQKKRAQRLKKLMKATGMTLPQASHWLKVNGY